MKTATPTYVLVAILALASACNGRSASKYPGELGAPCIDDSDCKNGMLCSTLHLPGNPIPLCFAPCANADSECPEGSLCIDNTGLDSAGNVQTVRSCARRCDSSNFCRDLNPEFNACGTFGMPEAICGFKG